jgi:proline iminopeptidase
MLIVAAALIVALAVVMALTARTHTPPFRHPDGRLVEGSIAEERRVALGGWSQYVLIRGRDRTAPILLYVHGGPGTSEMPLLRVYNAALEQDFVVVTWDQRGTGKSYSASLDPATLTLDRMTRDLDELVDRLRAEFGQDRILLVCHSWGTQLGLEHVSRHPEKVAAYMGVGQVTSETESDALGYAWALAEARARGDDGAVRALEGIGPPPFSIANVKRQRKYIWRYGGVFHEPRSLLDLVFTSLKAPETSWPDVIAFVRGTSLSMQALWPTVQAFDANTSYPRLEVPVFFLLGRHDRQVSPALAAKYFERLQAPSKELIWFEGSAHSPPFEEPDSFNAAILRIAHEVRQRKCPSGADRAGEKRNPEEGAHTRSPSGRVRSVGSGIDQGCMGHMGDDEAGRREEEHPPSIEPSPVEPLAQQGQAQEPDERRVRGSQEPNRVGGPR